VDAVLPEDPIILVDQETRNSAILSSTDHHPILAHAGTAGTCWHHYEFLFCRGGTKSPFSCRTGRRSTTSLFESCQHAQNANRVLA